MDCTFNSLAIWGTQTRVDGPTGGGRRMQRETLPGVGGFHVYDLAPAGRVWIVRGRLTKPSLAGVVTAVNDALALRNNGFYDFVDNAGNSVANCLLSDFRTVGPYTGCKLTNNTAAVFVDVQGTVEEASPA